MTGSNTARIGVTHVPGLICNPCARLVPQVPSFPRKRESILTLVLKVRFQAARGVIRLKFNMDPRVREDDGTLQDQTFMPGRLSDAVLPPSTANACPVT